MSPAALLAAPLLVAGTPPPAIDFGSVQLGAAAQRVLHVQALGAVATGAGYSAARTPQGIVIVFEPYELDEDAGGTLALRTRNGPVRIALRGRGMDTIPPRVTVETPHAARAGRLLTIHFAATDNDLVEACTLSVDGRPIGRVSWPASTFRWHLPAGRGGVVRITVTAVDRAGNRAAAVSTTRTIR